MKTKKMYSMWQGAAVLAAGLQAGAVMAAERPDAGQTLQQQAPTTAPVPSGRGYNPLEPETPDQSQAKTPDNGVRVKVKAVHVLGSSVFKAEDLESLYDAMIGTEQSYEQLKRATRLITRLYRKHGYAVARAYLPAQTIRNGVVTIQVLEGRLEKIELKNQSGVSDERLRALLGNQAEPGQLMDGARINRALLLMGDLPGVGRVQGSLQPGSTVGSTSLTVNVPDGGANLYEASLDNTGNRFTGQYRLTGHAQINNPMHDGDRLDFRASLSDESLAYARAAWDTPVGVSGLRTGVSVAFNRYQLGDQFSSLDAHGTSLTAGLTASYPLVLDVNRKITAELVLEQSRLNDVIGLFASDTDKKVQDSLLRLSGNYSGSSWSTAWRLEGTFGNLDIQSAKALGTDQLGPRTNGSFNKWGVSASVLKSLGGRSSLYATVTSQFANKNLDSSQKMVLGGVNGIRAYPAGEGLGDEGWQGSLEWRQALLPLLQGVVFVDAGGVKINHDPFAAGVNSRNLHGYGVGINAQPVKPVMLKMSIAWRGGEAPQSDKDQKPRIWLQGNYVF